MGPATVVAITTCSATVVATLILYWRWSSWIVIPHDIPWISHERQSSIWRRWYARINAHLKDKNEGWEFVSSGYQRYGKAGKPFVVPSFMTWQPEVVLPPTQLRWLVDQPDTVLSISKALIKDLEFSYTAPLAWSFGSPFHVEAINKLKLETLVEAMAEEVGRGIDQTWGMGCEWRSVNIAATMQTILLRVTSRVFVGEPVCHNPKYLTAASNWLTSLGPMAGLISLTPELLRPISGWYFTTRMRAWNRECAGLTTPLIKTALSQQSNEQQQPTTTLLESLARCASRTGNAKDQGPFSLASRLLALNFVAVHTSRHTLINTLVDIASVDVLEDLRVETEEAYKSCNGRWSKQALGRLVKIDSAIRESLRLNTFKARGLERIVVKPGGLVLPSGEHLPEGTKVGIAVLPTHHDADNFENPLQYRPYRFCSGSGRKLFNADLINSSETFLAWGHGKHVCPGRFLAAYEMKLIVAYIAMNYDIQPLSERPKNARMSDFSSGVMHNLVVRRRIGEANG